MCRVTVKSNISHEGETGSVCDYMTGLHNSEDNLDDTIQEPKLDAKCRKALRSTNTGKSVARPTMFAKISSLFSEARLSLGLKYRNLSYEIRVQAARGRLAIDRLIRATVNP